MGRATVVFPDMDGVIVEICCEHVKCWSEFRLMPWAVEGIAWFAPA